MGAHSLALAFFLLLIPISVASALASCSFHGCVCPALHLTLLLLLAVLRAARGHGSKSGQHVQPQQSLQQPQKSLQPPGSRAHKSRGRRDDLLQTAMASQQAQCVRMIVDALLEGRFSKASVVAHMYEALQALIHDPQVTVEICCLRGYGHCCLAYKRLGWLVWMLVCI